MRRLGQALDRDPMAIYRHAADKDALLDGVIEHVAAELVTRREPDSNGTRIGKRFMHHTAHTLRGTGAARAG
jgi:AcrR family transcriptional regulator